MDEDPVIGPNILTEMCALNSAGKAVEFRVNVNESRDLVKTALSTRPPPKTPNDQLVCASMAKIAGEGMPPITIEEEFQGNWILEVTETISLAWSEWAQGRSERTRDLLARLRARQHDAQKVSVKTGAINLMSMYFWMTAVEALSVGDLAEAKRYWKRAMEVASHYGTDSNSLVSWTYVATFFPTDY